jgi:hypothetical protein
MSSQLLKMLWLSAMTCTWQVFGVMKRATSWLGLNPQPHPIMLAESYHTCTWQVSGEIKRASSWLTIGKLMLIPLLPAALASTLAIYVVCAPFCSPPSHTHYLRLHRSHLSGHPLLSQQCQ